MDRMAFGVVGGEERTLEPSSLRILYLGDLENPEALFAQQGMAWARGVDLSEPVEVSVNDDGEFCLEDGHHRWFAAMKTERVLRATITIKGKPIERILAQQEHAGSRKPKAPR
jgi:hypothetical protein